MKVEQKGHTTTIKDTESSFDAFLEKCLLNIANVTQNYIQANKSSKELIP